MSAPDLVVYMHVNEVKFIWRQMWFVAYEMLWYAYVTALFYDALWCMNVTKVIWRRMQFFAYEGLWGMYATSMVYDA